MRLIRVAYVCDVSPQNGKAMWRMRDDLGRLYEVFVDSVSASCRSFWIWV